MNTNTTTYIVIKPNGVVRVAHFATACKIARYAELAAKRAHGAQAGADCHLVIQRGNQFIYRGLLVDRTTIGENFGCGSSHEQTAREFAALNVERATLHSSQERGMHLLPVV